MKLEATAQHLKSLIDSDPVAAIEGARQLDFASDGAERWSRMSVRAAILVDAGESAGDRAAIDEAVRLLRELQSISSNPAIAYNLANALTTSVGNPPHDTGWIDHLERTREVRLEARQLLAGVASDRRAERTLRTQAWTNLANQLSQTWRFGEAHDCRLAALRLDPRNGVAAGAAARDLLWLHRIGICAPTTRIEAAYLAKVARQNGERITRFAGRKAADDLATLADEVGDVPERKAHRDPFLRWVEQERLTLAPTAELVEPSLGEIDWLALPDLLEREDGSAATPPPAYAMFNLLKGDFVLARDLAWRATTQAWNRTARYADTLDYARYGTETAALVLSHRTALDLLDKAAVLANHYFALGETAERVYFRTIWRTKNPRSSPDTILRPQVGDAIRAGAFALFALVEMAADYDKGWLQPQRHLRNAGTHRFVVLHDEGGERLARHTNEVERHDASAFEAEMIHALRVARSALQVLMLAIRQHEDVLCAGVKGFIGTLAVPDHDWVRGRE